MYILHFYTSSENFSVFSFFCKGISRNYSERSESVTSDPDLTKLPQEQTPSGNLGDDSGDIRKSGEIITGEPVKDGDDDAEKDSGIEVKGKQLLETSIKDSGIEVKGKQLLDTAKMEEHENAVQLIEELVKILPSLLNLTRASEVDETLQKFSSDFSDSKFYYTAQNI